MLCSVGRGHGGHQGEDMAGRQESLGVGGVRSGSWMEAGTEAMRGWYRGCAAFSGANGTSPGPSLGKLK